MGSKVKDIFSNAIKIFMHHCIMAILIYLNDDGLICIYICLFSFLLFLIYFLFFLYIFFLLLFIILCSNFLLYIYTKNKKGERVGGHYCPKLISNSNTSFGHESWTWKCRKDTVLQVYHVITDISKELSWWNKC